MRIKLIIEYDGTNYYGWQIQPDRRTIQGDIEKALRKIFTQEIRIDAAGRTDRGVHALGQVASFEIPMKMSPLELKKAINGNIDRDIRIKECSVANEDFHARFKAKSRLYQYRIYDGMSVFHRRYFYQIKKTLSLPLMREAGIKLLGERDFSNLATRDQGLCYVKALGLRKKGKITYITIAADHFLRRMVRGIAGLLLSVGSRRLSPDNIEKVITGDIKRPKVVPPQGLFLLKVIY